MENPKPNAAHGPAPAPDGAGRAGRDPPGDRR